jgi:hypothetical protein
MGGGRAQQRRYQSFRHHRDLSAAPSAPFATDESKEGDTTASHAPKRTQSLIRRTLSLRRKKQPVAEQQTDESDCKIS